MSSNNFEIATNDLEILLLRVQGASGSKRDADIARELDVSTSNIPTWRKRGTIPYKELFQWADKKDISLNWLFYGVPPMLVGEVINEAGLGQYDSFDPESLEIAIECIELYINKLDLKVSPTKKAKVIKLLYPLIRDDDDNEVPDNVIDLLKLAAEVEEEEGNNNEQKEQMVESNKGQG